MCRSWNVIDRTVSRAEYSCCRRRWRSRTMWSGKSRRSWIRAFATANWSISFIGWDTDLTSEPGSPGNIFRTPPKPSPSFIYSTQIVLRLQTFPLTRPCDPDVERAYLRQSDSTLPTWDKPIPARPTPVSDVERDQPQTGTWTFSERDVLSRTKSRSHL